MGPLAILVCFSCPILVLGLLAFLNKTLRKPILRQREFNARGIRGPPYKFLFGNAREIQKMKTAAAAKPMSNLSHEIRTRLEPHLATWTEAYGKNFVFWMGPEPILVVTEPELVKVVGNNAEKVYQKLEAEGYIKKLFGDGLVTSRGEKWAKMRKLVNHAFQGDSLKSMVPAMVASTEVMLQRTAFGSSYFQGKLVFDGLAKLLQLATKHALNIQIPGLSKVYKPKDEIEAEKLEQQIRDVIIAMVTKREEMVTNGDLDSCGSDFLGLLVKARYEDDESKRISVDNVVDECKTFYLAGHETCDILLTWAMLLLSIHTDWQEEARKEVMTHFGNKTPDADGIMKLKTMTMIINETLRLYPPAFEMMRKVDKEVQLGKFRVPANTNIIISYLSLHHDPKIWGEDVHHFKPDRFSQGLAKATNNVQSVHIPFGMGARICAGYNFAPILTKIALSMILQRYAFTLSPAYVHSPIYAFTIRPQFGVQVIFQAL
ncbi:unnamed protein product [Linum tenue]|uniref:Cytochrome P450 n=1 Tax=Linum tenue TaxID=586396 RepID=A0AAV0NWR2_9ROSI|nr:unnamed protein product [Linum tenue]